MRTPAWTDRVLWRRNQIAGQVAAMRDEDDEDLEEGNINICFQAKKSIITLRFHD